MNRLPIHEPGGPSFHIAKGWGIARGRAIVFTGSEYISHGSGILSVMQILGLTVPGHDQNILRAHKHCIKHRAEIECSKVCGCFYCFAVYPPTDIVEWIDDEQTALCPKCPVDSVIGSASGFPITREFLQRMHDYWFSTKPT